MPLQNMVAIQTVTVGAGGASSISFTSIPQTYTDLVIVASTRQSGTGAASLLGRFNSSATGYSARQLFGYGTTVGSTTAVGGGTTYADFGLQGSADRTASTFGNISIYIPSYTGSSNKSFSVDATTEDNSASGAFLTLNAGFWANTAAITSIDLTCQNGNFVQYTTATLYGVTSTIAGGAKAYGGTVTEDANYFYHTFLASGTFTPTANLSCDYLVVAGGGGGGATFAGGGGGGGGLKTGTLSVTSSTNYTVTIGAGGAGSTNQSNRGTVGENSVFSSVTSTGGGGGGSSGISGGNGGSGGGGGGSSSTNTAGTASPSGEGNNGGTGSNNNAGNFGAGGGGGGAGAVGSNASSSSSAIGGNGGNGSASSMSGLSVTYAGGGGGGVFATGEGFTRSTGGTGGGGAGGDGDNAAGNSPVNGTANLGGGGGGAGYGQNGAAGGSGIVIVRYAK